MHEIFKQKHRPTLLFNFFLSLVYGAFVLTATVNGTSTEAEAISELLYDTLHSEAFSQSTDQHKSTERTDADAIPATDEMTTTDSISSTLECYSCDFGSIGQCQDTNWPLECVTNMCYLNITRSGGSWDSASMGCISDIEDCVYYESPEQCSTNDTTCLLCCNTTWCNMDVLYKLNIATSEPMTNSRFPDHETAPGTPELVTAFPSPDQETTARTGGGPSMTTDSSSSTLECYSCDLGSIGQCQDTNWPLECVTNMCYLNITRSGGSWDSASMGCISDIEDCLYYDSPEQCSTNDTACLLCCNTTWCNMDVLYKLNIATSEPMTNSRFPDHEITEGIPEVATVFFSTELENTDETPKPLITFSSPDQDATPGTSEPGTTITASALETSARLPESDAETLNPIENYSTMTSELAVSTVSKGSESSTSLLSFSTASNYPALTTQRNWILQCYECLGEPSPSCSTHANVKQCLSTDEVCYWLVNNTGSSFTSSKGCIPKNECNALSASNNASCSDFTTVKEQCIWCCEDTHRCNYDRGNYSEISEPTNLPPTEYCDASYCLLQFQLLVAEASKEPDLFFNEFCRSVPSVFACLSNATSQCASCDGGLTVIMESILNNMTAQCPVPCDPIAGYNCTFSFYYDIVESLSQGIDCKEISEIEIIRGKCRVRTVGSCDAGVREAVDVTYAELSKEIEVICNATYPNFPPFEGTESPNCNIQLGLKCITDYGEMIIKYFLQQTDNLKQICESSLRSKECYEEIALVCSDGKRQSLNTIWNFTFGLIAEKCITKICDTTKARRCILDLMSLIEAKKDIQGACRMIPETIDCVSINTGGCIYDEQESLNNTLKYTLDLIGDQCNNHVQVFANETITICEGDNPVQISYILNSSPSSICGLVTNCQIFIDFEIEIGSYPRCRNGNPIRQAVIVRSSSQGSSGSLCSNEVTEENWSQLQNVSVAAKLDFKYDKTQYRQMIIWYRKTINNVTMERRSLSNITLVICDGDRANAICSSVNDPHIKTFDGWYYNNFLEGFFILYRHRYLPFEVQIATQRCNGRATCNCAIYVRSGDTVFAIDKCRKKSFFEKWCLSRNIDKFKCSNVMKFHLYGYDRITPGTKIYSRNNGKQYLVIFPSGTQVKITVDGNYISVYITPSPIDFRNTAGLCGLFDNNARNDLVLRNGKPYAGEGYYQRGQPKDFCKDWRSALTENIYQGVAKRPFNPDLYCECDGSKNSSPVNSNCNTNALLELCDLDTSGEEILPPFEYSESLVDNDDDTNVGNENKRQRRQMEANPIDDFDIEENFDPPNIPDDNTTVALAAELCQKFFNSIAVAQMCQNESVADFTTSVAGCIDDLVVTNDTSWMAAALDSLKEQCLKELSQNPMYIDNPEKALIAEKVQSASCPSQCNSNGNCIKGVCMCDAGYTGVDCGFNLTMQLDYLEVYNSFCDLKKGDCSKAQITGVGFIPNITSCRAQPVMVTDKGIEIIGNSEEVDLIFVSPNEAHCELNRQASALIDVFNTDFTQNSSLFIIIYDSTCYSCSSLPTIHCDRVINSCLISGGCYGPGQENPIDKCMICRPENSDSEWTFNSDSDSCNSNIPLIVGLCVGLGGGLILLTILVIIIVYKVHCAGSRKLPSLDEYETMSHSSVHRSHNFSYDSLFKPEQIEVAGSCRSGQFSIHKEGPPPDYIAPVGATTESFGL